MSNINKTYVFETVLISGGTTGTTIEFITGATFNISTGDLVFETVSGATINVPLDGRYTLTGHTHDISDITGFTDNSTNWDISYNDSITGVTVTGGLSKTITLQQRDGSTITADFDDLVGGSGGGSGNIVTGMTFNTGTGDLTLSTLSGDTIVESLDGRYSLDSALTSHTGDTSIHFTVDSINLSDLGSSGHTHNLSELNNDVGFLTGATSTDNDYVTGSTFNTTNGVLTFTRLSGGTFNVDLDDRYSLTGHTHTVSQITDFPTDLSAFTNSQGYLTGATSTDNDYVTSGSFNTTNGEVTLTRLSGGTVVYDLDGRYSLTGHTHNLSELNNDVGFLTGATSTDNDYVTGATFDINTGILELARLSGGTVIVDLDDRYSLTGHTHDFSTLTNTGHTHTISEVIDFPTNVSYFTNDVGYLTGATSTADDYVSGGTFNTETGDLDLIRLSGGTVTINLDNRYIVAGPITFSAETSGTTTYVGYGTVSACKIRKIDTVSGSTYTAYWSGGVETLDKIWANRYSYSYF